MNTPLFFHSVEVMLGYGRGTKVTSLDNVSNSGRITLLIKGTPYEFKDPLSNLGLSHYSLLLQSIFNECSIEQVYQLGQWLVKTVSPDNFGDFSFQGLPDNASYSLQIQKDGRVETFENICTKKDINLGDIPLT